MSERWDSVYIVGGSIDALLESDETPAWGTPGRMEMEEVVVGATTVVRVWAHSLDHELLVRRLGPGQFMLYHRVNTSSYDSWGIVIDGHELGLDGPGVFADGEPDRAVIRRVVWDDDGARREVPQAELKSPPTNDAERAELNGDDIPF